MLHVIDNVLEISTDTYMHRGRQTNRQRTCKLAFIALDTCMYMHISVYMHRDIYISTTRYSLAVPSPNPTLPLDQPSDLTPKP